MRNLGAVLVRLYWAKLPIRSIGLGALLIFGLASACWAPFAVAQLPASTITFTPTNPTNVDVIKVHVDTHVTCYPLAATDGVTTTIVGSQIQILASLSYCPSFTTPPSPYAFDIDVGPLASGVYQLQYSARFSSDGGSTYSVPQVFGTAPIVILAGGTSEPIPTLGGSAITLLVIAIAATGAAFLGQAGRQRMLVLGTTLAASFLLDASDTRAMASFLEQASDLASRQLIVLFNPEDATSPAPSEIGTAVTIPTSNPALYSILGMPRSAYRLLEGTSSSNFRAQLATQDPMSSRVLLERYVVLTYDTPEAAQTAKKALEHNAQVLSVEASALLRFSPTPNDQYFSYSPSRPYSGSYQWGMQLLNLPRAWDKERGFAYVGAIDNGIYCVAGTSPCVAHADLQQNFRPQFSRAFASITGSSSIDEMVSGLAGHGTHVAGIIAATPQYGPFDNHSTNSGVAGTCWTCSLAVLRTEQTSPDAVLAISFAADHGLQVINMSWGDEYSAVFPPYTPRYTSCNDAPYSSLCVALAYARDRDVAAVGASGNGYENRIQFPARLSGVIAAGGVEVGGGYFRNGYGNCLPGNYCPPCAGISAQACTCTPGGLPGQECGSNYGTQDDGTRQVVGPARDVISTFYYGHTWNQPVHCGDTYGPSSGVLESGYGDCTGTSMAAPHIAGVVGLLRSANPLLSVDQIKAILVNNTTSCTGVDSDKCGYGIPDANAAIASVMGTAGAKNRLTPLFSFYGAQANDHLYTVVPQMALAALNSGQLIPQPPAGSVSYAPIGTPTPGYAHFPIPAGCFSPCPSASTPMAMVSVFTSHVDPTNASAELVPLYRMSWACSGACSHVSHFYTTDPAGIAAMQTVGYVLDGIEGYIFPSTRAQPPGTVRLCRKYAPSPRDDYVLFAGTGTNGTTCGSNDGYTRDSGGNLINDYTQTAGNTDWIGWVYPVRAPQAIYSTAYLAATNLFLLD